MGGTVWIGRGLVLLSVLALGLSLPALFFDDAYITLRYAANLAAGDGFAFNPGERVLGVTTPLLVLLLAAAARLGIDLETAALLSSLAGHALLGLIVFEALPEALPSPVKPSVPLRLLAAAACVLHPHLAITAMGGMETPIYCALVVAVLWTAALGRAAAAGACLGLALLARPDAVLLAPLAAWMLRGRSGRRTWAALPAWAASAAAVAGPWLAWAWWRFGSPIPHSIAAKKLSHAATPSEVAGDLGRFLADDGYLIVALPLAVWGLVAARRRPMAGAAGAFVVVYVAALLFGGIQAFPWYANPPIPFIMILAASGAAHAAARIRLDRPAVWAAATIALMGGAGLDLRRQAAGLRESWEEWEGAYEVAGHWLMQASRPGDSVYVGEVGVLGYLLRGRVVIDSSGINSLAVHQRRAGRDDADPEWSRRVVQDLRPDFIATSEKYAHIQALAREAWFARGYEKVDVPLLEETGKLIYRRRRAP